MDLQLSLAPCASLLGLVHLEYALVDSRTGEVRWCQHPWMGFAMSYLQLDCAVTPLCYVTLFLRKVYQANLRMSNLSEASATKLAYTMALLQRPDAINKKRPEQGHKK